MSIDIPKADLTMAEDDIAYYKNIIDYLWSRLKKSDDLAIERLSRLNVLDKLAKDRLLEIHELENSLINSEEWNGEYHP